MYNKTDPNQNDLDVLFMFLSKDSLGEKNIIGSGALKFNSETNQLFFVPESKKNTLILLAEWVGSVLLVRNWVRDRGTYSRKNHFSYSMSDYAGSLIYYLSSKPRYQNTVFIEVDGVIKNSHRDEAKLLNATIVL